MLEQMFQMSRAVKRPVAMFVDQSDSASIQASVDAGVSAYIVDGLKKERIASILDLCISRFNAFARLQVELDRAKGALEERKVIDRAKGVLMQAKKLTEERSLCAVAQDRDERKQEDRRNCAIGADGGGAAQMSEKSSGSDTFHWSTRRRLWSRSDRGFAAEGPRRRTSARGVMVERSRQAQYRPVRRRAPVVARRNRFQPRHRPRASTARCAF